MVGVRMTLPTQLVIRTLLEHPTRELYGLEICDKAGLPSGTIHPILARLERVGWLESRWERPEEFEGSGRPARRYYTFTKDGAELARLSLAAVYKSRPTLLPVTKPREA